MANEIRNNHSVSIIITERYKRPQFCGGKTASAILRIRKR